MADPGRKDGLLITIESLVLSVTITWADGSVTTVHHPSDGRATRASTGDVPRWRVTSVNVPAILRSLATYETS